jgi:hypothetical protein
LHFHYSDCVSEEITKKFPYFPVLHKFLGAKSSIVPPVITTGIGPKGRKVLHLQPSSRTKINDENSDSKGLLQLSPERSQSPEEVVPASSPEAWPTSPLATAPNSKASHGKTAPATSILKAAVTKANANGMYKQSKKSFEDNLVEMQS